MVITGKVYALDPIFSPYAYARTVFGERYFNQVEFSAEDKCLHFTYKGDCGVSPESFVEKLIPSSKDGRKVEVNFCYKN